MNKQIILFIFFLTCIAHASASMHVDHCSYSGKRCAENGHELQPAPAFRILRALNAEFVDIINHPDSNKRDMFIAVCLSTADQYKRHAGTDTHEAVVYARLNLMARLAQKPSLRK